MTPSPPRGSVRLPRPAPPVNGAGIWVAPARPVGRALSARARRRLVAVGAVLALFGAGVGYIVGREPAPDLAAARVAGAGAGWRRGRRRVPAGALPLALPAKAGYRARYDAAHADRGRGRRPRPSSRDRPRRSAQRRPALARDRPLRVHRERGAVSERVPTAGAVAVAAALIGAVGGWALAPKSALTQADADAARDDARQRAFRTARHQAATHNVSDAYKRGVCARYPPG